MGFEPTNHGFAIRSSESVSNHDTKTSNDDEKDLAFCLALLRRKSPDLALLAERWDALPEALRAGIMAMIRAADERSS